MFRGAIGRAISARAGARPGTDRRRRVGDASIRARTGAGAAIIRPVPLRSAYSPFRCVRGRNDATLSFLPRHAKFFGRGWFVPFAPQIGGVSMRAPIALPVMLSLLCAGITARVDAQIALPSVQLPRTLPSLPEIGAAPLTAVRDTLAQE